MKKRTIKVVKQELEELTSYFHLARHPRVQKIIKELEEENKPKAQALEKELEDLRNGQKIPSRFPENTPAEIIKCCEEYWAGTTEFTYFRIHLWNDKGIWTSYPSGGFSNNGGWNPTSPHYFLISREEKELTLGRDKPKTITDFEIKEGKRITKEIMQTELNKL